MKSFGSYGYVDKDGPFGFWLEALIVNGAFAGMIGAGWVYYFRKIDTHLKDMVEATLIFPPLLFLLYRFKYINLVLRPRNERIIFDEDSLVYISYRGKEDARIPYEKISDVEIDAFKSGNVEGRWAIVGASQRILVRSDLAQITLFWDEFAQHCPAKVPQLEPDRLQ